ncbi:hypothetical protein ES703_86162 [subsurface metagenome]
MDENVKDEFEEEEKETELDIEKEKKEQELGLKKKQAFSLNQSKDSMIEISEWGSFRIRPTESLEILEIESFYRTPLTNIIENENDYNLLVELPGLGKKHVNITLQDGVLEIIGEKALKYKEEKEDKKEKDKKDKYKNKKDKKKEKGKKIEGDYLRREFRSASFFRSFHLPEEINLEGIDASFKNGVLRLKIPKKTSETEDKKVIEIK